MPTRKLAKGYIKRIHVDKNKIGKDPKPITIQTSSGPINAAEAEWDGPTKLVYRPERSLPSGAKVWIETKSEVRIKP